MSVAAIVVIGGRFIQWMAIKVSSVPIALALFSILPALNFLQFTQPSKLESLSRHSYARTFGIACLEPLPHETLVFTRSDLYFVFRYLNEIEKYREDVHLISRNDLTRFKHLSSLKEKYGELEIPSTSGNDYKSWIRQIIDANRGDYPIAWELADDIHLVSHLNVELKGPFLIEKSRQESFETGRDLDFFNTHSSFGERFRSDRHAVELISMLFYNRGSFLLKREGFIDALRNLNLALNLEPDSAEIHNNIGVAYMGLNELEAAKFHFKYALTLDPHHANANRNLQLLRVR